MPYFKTNLYYVKDKKTKISIGRILTVFQVSEAIILGSNIVNT